MKNKTTIAHFANGVQIRTFNKRVSVVDIENGKGYDIKVEEHDPVNAESPACKHWNEGHGKRVNSIAFSKKTMKDIILGVHLIEQRKP